MCNKYTLNIMAKRGCPPKYTKKFRKQLLSEFDQYINKTTIPIIAEFAYQHEIPKQTFYDWPEFSNLLKRCTAKKETNLEKGMLSNQFPTAAAIFALKQLGWSDKQEVTHSGNAGLQLIISDQFKPQKGEQGTNKSIKNKQQKALPKADDNDIIDIKEAK